MSEIPLQSPTWALPSRVQARQTLRGAATEWGFNLAGHVGAPEPLVRSNRAVLIDALPGAHHIGWLDQVHGTTVAQLPVCGVPQADAAVSRVPGVWCAVMTADCLPVLFADEDGTVVAAAHAGWRGLCAGILEATIAAMAVEPRRVHAWLGPRIGATAFEVGAEVRAAFIDRSSADAAAFRPALRTGYFWADLAALAHRRLTSIGVAQITDSRACTIGEPQRWFSYRREGRCGRMASLIGLVP